MDSYTSQHTVGTIAPFVTIEKQIVDHKGIEKALRK